MKIAFQGELGAYSHEACVNSEYADHEVLPCASFEDCIDAVKSGNADKAMLPVENSTYGRVADIHRLLPDSGLHIIGEAFVRVHINLLAPKGSTLSDIKDAYSHLVLLPQCASFLKTNNIKGHVSEDNAKAAREIYEWNDCKCVLELELELDARVGFACLEMCHFLDTFCVFL